MHSKFFYVVGNLWMAPVTVVAWFGVMVSFWLGWIHWGYWYTGRFPFFYLKPNSWLGRKFPNLRGWAWGPFVVIRSRLPKGIRELTIEHEMRHVEQMMVLSVFQWILYLVFLCVVGYKKNPFEIDARRTAARRVEERRRIFG